MLWYLGGVAAFWYKNGECEWFWKSDSQGVGWKIDHQVAAIESDIEFKDLSVPNCLVWKVMSGFKERLASDKR